MCFRNAHETHFTDKVTLMVVVAAVMIVVLIVVLVLVGQMCQGIHFIPRDEKEEKIQRTEGV
jgi:hypothetical protein